MTAGAPSYSATCRHCARLSATAPRFSDAELTALREHIRWVHRREALLEDADAGDVLRHFDVRRLS